MKRSCLKHKRGIAPETCKVVKPMLGSRLRIDQTVIINCQVHKLPSSPGRRMRKEVQRFGAINSRMNVITAALAALIGVVAGLVALGTAWADALEDFYKGRAVDLYIGYSVGGAY